MQRSGFCSIFSIQSQADAEYVTSSQTNWRIQSRTGRRSQNTFRYITLRGGGEEKRLLQSKNVQSVAWRTRHAGRADVLESKREREKRVCSADKCVVLPRETRERVCTPPECTTSCFRGPLVGHDVFYVPATPPIDVRRTACVLWLTPACGFFLCVGAVKKGGDAFAVVGRWRSLVSPCSFPGNFALIFCLSALSRFPCPGVEPVEVAFLPDVCSVCFFLFVFCSVLYFFFFLLFGGGQPRVCKCILRWGFRQTACVRA